MHGVPNLTPESKNKTMSRKCLWCAMLAPTLLVGCASLAADPDTHDKRAILEDHPDYSWVGKHLDEVYQEAISHAIPDQRSVFTKEHVRWFLEREKLENDPDTYIAYSEQEIRDFAGNYDEP